MSTATFHPSGIGPVDDAWGGLARPGAYLLVGSAAQGRLDLSSRIVGAGTSAASLTLLFSAREPGAILSVARQAGVDLGSAGDRVQLKGVPLGAQLAALGESGLAQMLDGLAEAADGAGLVVVEDFTPFVRFRSFDAFGAAFRKLVAAIEGHGSTLVLGLGEPANDGSRKLLDFVEGVVTGTIRLADGGRSVQLIPGTGHAGRAADAPWSRLAAPPRESAGPVETEAPVEFRDHGADGYGGTDAQALDAGALVVSTVPSEPFGLTPAAPPPAYPPPTEPGGDGQDWATIQPIDAPPTELAERYGTDVLAGGVLVDSGHPATASPLSPPAAAPQPPPAPEPVPPPVATAPAFAQPAVAPVREALIGDTDFGAADPEAGFAVDLDEAFASGEHFLVVAIRMAADSPHFGTFPTVADGLLAALAGDDRALVRDDEARLVVLLPRAPADAPERLVSALRAHMDTVLGARSESAFAAVGVLVLPDGRPFHDAAGLLQYALS